MEVDKQIREIIEFYCGGTYENRNTATKEILQICQNLQLQQTGVSGCYIERICDSCNTGYIPELYRDSDGKQATVNFQDCPNCGKRDDIWVKVHSDNNVSQLVVSCRKLNTDHTKID